MQKLSIFKGISQDKNDVFHDPSLLLSSAVTYDIYYHGTTSCKGTGDKTDAKRALDQFHGKSSQSTISINCRQIVIKSGLEEIFKANLYDISYSVVLEGSLLFAVKMGPKKFQWHRAESREINSVNKCIGQAFDLAYHLWCGSAQKQHETHHAEIHQIESRLKSLENHYRALRRKVDDLKTHQKHQLSMEDTVISSEEERLEIPILPFNRSRRGSRASGLGILGGDSSSDIVSSSGSEEIPSFRRPDWVGTNEMNLPPGPGPTLQVQVPSLNPSPSPSPTPSSSLLPSILKNRMGLFDLNRDNSPRKSHKRITITDENPQTSEDGMRRRKSFSESSGMTNRFMGPTHIGGNLENLRENIYSDDNSDGLSNLGRAKIPSPFPVPLAEAGYSFDLPGSPVCMEQRTSECYRHTEGNCSLSHFW
ncbi:Oidioi.mRNA.OKI2018_I69.PAR.g10120.t1.cds [Oikopleura dioica]|uniref:Oidioi.mRNA.OKI2018_I69.PAR.g10120.t1.cds n=1 Tax=Oikopleura dioica TaxID=34765 RepID=A0ABN7RSJ0_OIKDI|nr:Oidioi.mRNA.OKI2018_I69.PAR.g10120.t1.cds [Oikopleura dioica]